jgi:hypothetical protein
LFPFFLFFSFPFLLVLNRFQIDILYSILRTSLHQRVWNAVKNQASGSFPY